MTNEPRSRTPCVAEGATVPSLWRVEIANILGNGVRRGRCKEAYVDRPLARLARLAIKRDEETDDHSWGSTGTLARKESLSDYDAAYLELALRKRTSFASPGQALLAAGARRKAQVFAA